MIKRYPHDIFFTATGESAQDENGNWVTPAAVTSELKGRYDIEKGAGGITKTPDGSEVRYEGILWTEKVVDVVFGQQITVKNGEKIVASGTVKNFHTGQQNTRIWI